MTTMANDDGLTDAMKREVLADMADDQQPVSVFTLRAAIADVLDKGWQCGADCDLKHPWRFPTERFEGDTQPSDDDLRLREGFINAVAARVAELQAAPHHYDTTLLAKLRDARAEYQRGYRDGWSDGVKDVDEALKHH